MQGEKTPTNTRVGKVNDETEIVARGGVVGDGGERAAVSICALWYTLQGGSRVMFY